MRKPVLLHLASLMGLCLWARCYAAGEILSLSVTNDRGELVLSWPGWAADGILDQSSEPSGPVSWTPVPTNLYQSKAGAFEHRLSPLGQARFYRLRRLGSPVPGLAGLWGFDEAGGQLGTDPGFGTILAEVNVTRAEGRFGGAWRFNGQPLEAGGSVVWMTNASYRILPPPSQPFSISLWFNPDALPAGSRGILGCERTENSGWDVALYSAGPGTNHVVWAGVGSGSNVTDRILMVPGQWHQLTLTSGSNQISLYLDSRLLARAPGALLNGPGRFYIGGGTTAHPGFLGRLDEVRIYTNALSREQIELTGQWHFDESASSLAADSSVRGHVAAVVSPAAWVPGKIGSGIDLSAGPIAIANHDYSVLPSSGAPFSLSLWIFPRELASGQSGLLSCAEWTNRGWQVSVAVDGPSQAWLDFSSTNLGGTLSLRAPLALTNGAWTKLDLTYNGGIATVYVNGCKVHAEPGAIRAAATPLILGAAPGMANFNGVIDELRVYSRERAPNEIGPVVLPIWEMALVNSSTNLVLQGSGPPGKPLTFAILSEPAPTLGTISASSGSPVITYSAGGQKGPDSFAYTVSDGEFTSPPATGVVSVVQPHWLSPSGGILAAQNGTAPEQAWFAGTASAMDAILQTNNNYDCFFYAPGLYQTRGWKYRERSTANPGCKHIGSGSEGASTTTIQLVDNWSAWEEGVIFGKGSLGCDGFEVRNLVLDCNAGNNPKYVLGEPVWLRVPLVATARVDSITLHWSDPSGAWVPYRHGRAAELSLCTRSVAGNEYVTNRLALTGTNTFDPVAVEADTDELLLSLTRRADGVDYYGLAEMKVAGAAISLPTAMIPGGGESRLDERRSILSAIDGDSKSAWASGPEDVVEITLPLSAGTSVSQINLRWDCKTLPDLRRLGPAATYLIYAREPNTGQLSEVRFVSHGREPEGREIATFGTPDSTNSLSADYLLILLTSREPGVDYYSLREIQLQNGARPVALRVPTAMNSLGLNSIIKAFDDDLSTEWASGTQGSVAAIDVTGSNLKFLGLKVLNFGTKAGRECFGLASGAPALSASHPEPLRNVLVEDCLFTQPATNNTDGVTAVAVVGLGPGSLINATVRRCRVMGLKSHFTYSHAYAATWVENSLAQDCENAVYFEPDPKLWAGSIGPVTVRSNQFLNVVRGVSLDFHPGGRFDSLQCLDNEIVLADSGIPSYGVRVCDACVTGPSGGLTNVTVLNNVIRYADWTPRQGALDGGLIYTDIRHAVFGNNVIVLGNPNALRVRHYPASPIPDEPPPEDCDNPRLVVPGPSLYPASVDPLLPGYRRAWFNNLDLSGALLPVYYWETGVDRLASQQQWP